jgi:hypothetical protein
MKIEIDVKFNIGDKVIVKETSGNGLYGTGQLPIKAVISGYAINKDTKRTTVYYFIEPLPNEVDRLNAYNLTQATSHRRRYNAKWLEKVED